MALEWNPQKLYKSLLPEEWHQHPPDQWMNSNPTASAILLCPQSEQVHKQTEKMVNTFNKQYPRSQMTYSTHPQPLHPYQWRFLPKIFWTLMPLKSTVEKAFHFQSCLNMSKNEGIKYPNFMEMEILYYDNMLNIMLLLC